MSGNGGTLERTFSVDLNPCGSVLPEVIDYVNRVLDNGKLYRYDCKLPEESEVSLMEQEIADYTGAKYAIAMNSCSSAIYTSLLCAGVKPGDKVLIPAFTFTAVPSAVMHAGATPVLVEVTDSYYVDIEDLERKITDETRVLLLSHMRGHIGNMDEIVRICEKHNLWLIEDAAHALGMTWDGRHSGTIGHIGCYSTQSYKLIDAGEGGILVTDDDHVAAKAIIYAGSYETKWKSHMARPEIVDEYQDMLPSFNFRMNNLTAAVVRAQIPMLPERVAFLTEKYERLAELVNRSEHIQVPVRHEKLTIAPDSIQFNLVGLTDGQKQAFIERCNDSGIVIGIFGGENTRNARCYWNWKYLGDVGEHPQTREMLASACDMRLPHALTMDDIEELGEMLVEIMDSVVK